MKKLLLSLVALMTFGVSAWADEVKVADVQIPQGKSADIQLYLDNASGSIYRDFGFTFDLPEGITRTAITAGEILPAAASIMPGRQTLVMCVPDEDAIEAGTAKVEDYYITSSGVLLNITLTASKDLAVGTVLQGTLKEFEIADNSGQAAIRTDITFNITIVDNLITLYDTDTEAPAAATDANVKVVRTLKAEQWSTICLPFAVADPEAVFGEGVKIADFTGCEASGEDGDYAASIKVKFSTVNAMEANRPYLIMVASELTEFTAEGVNIVPEEGPANMQDYARVKVGNKWYDWYNSFFGTYVADTEIPAGSIILSGNKFYLTKGTTTKGFRGWFYFDNCSIQDIEAAMADGSVKMLIDDDPTAIENIDIVANPEGIFDMSGRKLNDMPKTKGVYVIDGKKVAVK